MEIIPDNESNRTTAEAALNNFDVLGVEVQDPDHVIYGFTPRGGAAYDVLTNRIFMGRESSIADNRAVIANFQHETIHYDQYRRIMESIPNELPEKVSELEHQAHSTAIDEFDNSVFIDALTHDQRLNYHNFRTMMGLATENQGFLEELHDLREVADERKHHIETEDTEIDMTPEKVSYAASAQTAEEDVADIYWHQVLEEDEADYFSPLIERYDPHVEDDLLEAQAQLWSMLTLGLLKDMPETEGVYPDPVESKLETLEGYADDRFYDHGENVESATKDILEEFRVRKYSESKRDPEIVVEMLNDGLKYWNDVEAS